MERRKRIVLATENVGKAREFNHLFATSAIDIVPQANFNISTVAETGLTFVENALLKARHASANAQLPALADDSGLVVKALGGKPGIYSARYAGEQADATANIERLLTELASTPAGQRQAYFYCVLVYMESPNDPAPLICEGRWHGEILTESYGQQGFGYDPVFYVPLYNCSAAELAIDVKNSISHRAQATQALLKKLIA